MIDRNKSLDQDVSLDEPVCMKNESGDADKERPSASNKDQSYGAQNVTDHNNSQLKLHEGNHPRQISESELEAQFKRFLENQENNFKLFSQMIDRYSIQGRGQDTIEKKCLELRRRGELSIKLLKDQTQSPDLNMIQTQRKLITSSQGLFVDQPIALQGLSISSKPQPPSPGRIPKSNKDIPIMIGISSIPHSLALQDHKRLTAGNSNIAQPDIQQAISHNLIKNRDLRDSLSSASLNNTSQLSNDPLKTSYKPKKIPLTINIQSKDTQTPVVFNLSTLEILTICPPERIRGKPTLSNQGIRNDTKNTISQEKSFKSTSYIKPDRYTEKWIHPQSVNTSTAHIVLK